MYKLVLDKRNTREHHQIPYLYGEEASESMCLSKLQLAGRAGITPQVSHFMVHSSLQAMVYGTELQWIHYM